MQADRNPRTLSDALDVTAARFPEATAVRFAGEGLSYRDLARRSNDLAHALIAQGVRRGDRVGILMNKSLRSAECLHGIMKAGAAYVPLDPFAPSSRIGFVLQDCGIRHLITTDQKLGHVSLSDRDIESLDCLIGASSRPGVRSLTWDQVREGAPGRAPDMGHTDNDLAYILYTSGSTGTPKGIMHTHRSGLGFARWAATTYGMSPDDRVSNHAPLHFDLSTFDFFATAFAGATTVIIPEAFTKLPIEVGRLISDERLTVWYSVPYALIQLLERVDLSKLDLGALRWILFAGEVFPTKHLRNLQSALPHVGLSNLFGPTETNVCTYYNVPPLGESNEPIPIGRPCAGVDARIVDESGVPVADGTPGELWINGDIVMKGYWNRPDLSAAGFGHLEAATGSEARSYYRTGDLVERLPDGNLRYLGRKDRQIKARGHRVELDEVELALLSHPAVAEAAAYPVADENDATVIEAAVTALDGQSLDADSVVRHVIEKLPAYAVPSVVRVMESLPRTSTGKISRRELAAVPGNQ